MIDEIQPSYISKSISESHGYRNGNNETTSTNTINTTTTMVNLSKLIDISTIIRKVLKFREFKYHYHDVSSIQQFLQRDDDSLLKTSNAQFEKSLQLEPKYDPSAKHQQETNIYNIF